MYVHSFHLIVEILLTAHFIDIEQGIREKNIGYSKRKIFNLPSNLSKSGIFGELIYSLPLTQREII
jgi:hypothetical protein